MLIGSAFFEHNLGRHVCMLSAGRDDETSEQSRASTFRCAFDLSSESDQGKDTIDKWVSTPLLAPSWRTTQMVPNLTAPLRKALGKLEAQRHRIDREILAVRAALEALQNRRGRFSTSNRGKARRRRMSAAARRAVSQRMKAYWAKRRAGSVKSKAKGMQKAE